MRILFIFEARAEAVKDAKKLRQCQEALKTPDRFNKDIELDFDLIEAIEWLATKTPEEVALTINDILALLPYLMYVLCRWCRTGSG